MSMSQFLAAYWPYLAVIAATLLLVVVLVGRGRGQRVTFERRDDAGFVRTLAREAAPSDTPASTPVLDSDLTRLKGLGPRLAGTLAERGITSVAQLAALDEDGAAALDASLGTFAGRLARDRLLRQARLLEAGELGTFEAEFGKLGGDTR